MAAFLPHLAECACGATFVVDAAESVNVRRMPTVRDDVLASRLHRATCPACGQESTVETDFFYADPDRNFFCKVQQRGKRHLWADKAAALDQAAARLPPAMSAPPTRTLRVVFGMDELREKLLAQDAGLDDRVVELLKVFLTHEHPVLLERPRLRLRLDAQSPEELLFVAVYEHDPHRFELRLARDVALSIARRPDVMKKWLSAADRQDTSFAAGAQWVNMWKWSPQTFALRDLVGLSDKVRKGEIDLKSSKVRWILENIPRGAHLPQWAKQELTRLFALCRKLGLDKVEKTIFDVRFETRLSNDWATNRNRTDITTLWRLFQTLPPNNVEGNAKIKEIDYGQGSASTYDAKSRDIFIAADNTRTKKNFVSTVRHEVGHAVHERIKPVVDAWLEKRFGWRTFDASQADEIDRWVGLMGGWRGIGSAYRRDVRRQLEHAVGSRSGTWTAGKLAPLAPRAHPWNQDGFGPRLALERSGEPQKSLYWYDCYKTWYAHGPLRFACNFWYAQLMVVPASTLDIVTRIKSSYASMSPSEFFAEMYAANYDTRAASRNALPADVKQWFDCIVGKASDRHAQDAPHSASPAMRAGARLSA